MGKGTKGRTTKLTKLWKQKTEGTCKINNRERK